MMRLKTGDKAPNFKVEDIYGHKVSLSDYKDKKVMLAFFRYAGCPFCNLIFSELMNHYPRFHSMGLNIVAFFQSPQKSVLDQIAKYATVSQIKVPIVADPERMIYDLYGVEPSLVEGIMSLINIPSWLDVTLRKHFPQGKIDGNLLLMPAQFLIGPTGLVIKTAHYAANFADDIPYGEIMDFLLFEK